MDLLLSNENKKDSNNNKVKLDGLLPTAKRQCHESSSSLALSAQSMSNPPDNRSADKNESAEQVCKSCGKSETVLQTFPCPSVHHFCANCIFKWAKQHIHTKTTPMCLFPNCNYLLKIEDLDDLPVPKKDHQILLTLIQIHLDELKTMDICRLKCGKCDLYFDKHDLFVHHNECPGRSLMIPCEVCFCPILISEYEQHTLMCSNDDNIALTQFLSKYSRDPTVNVKQIKFMIKVWLRKNRQKLSVYDMIEELNAIDVCTSEICGVCEKVVPVNELYMFNCSENHLLCSQCYRQHLQRQMDKTQILTCHQCDYHLQDKDFVENTISTSYDISTFQNYQNKTLLNYYYETYCADDGNIAAQQSNDASKASSSDSARRHCDLCKTYHSYDNIFVLHCNCKICYDCFADCVRQQHAKTNSLLVCPLCRRPIKNNDLSYLRLNPEEIQSIKIYQQGKQFEIEHAKHITKQTNNQISNNTNNDTNDSNEDLEMIVLYQDQMLPNYWNLPMAENFCRVPLTPQMFEYTFVFNKFNESWNRSNTTNANIGVNATQMLAIQSQPTINPLTNINPPTNLYTPVMPQFAVVQPPFWNNNPSVINNNNNNGGLIINQQPPNFNGFGPPPFPTFTSTFSSAPPSSSTPPFIHPRPRTIYRKNSRAFPLPHHPPPTTPTGPTPFGQNAPMNAAVYIPQIIQIERIQNQRWYKQYAAHKQEFRQKLDEPNEQWLFHGCSEKSAKTIEVECFNRSFAGQHAVAYGQGCYFASDSLYSHNYATPDHQQLRRMFLARVLVGKTIQGKPDMRVPPSGYDTTGNGSNIFVTYYDSQAYAEYLITYR